MPIEQLPSYDSQHTISGLDADIKVIDLDTNGEPEGIVDLAEAGAHCCASSFIYSYNPKVNRYTVTPHFWGNFTSGYWLAGISGKEDDRKLHDLNGDGTYEFVALDDRFRGEFGGYAESAAPAQVWRYSQGELIDVTKEFSKVVYHSALDTWQQYSQVRSQDGPNIAQGAMAAYVATKFLLGQQADAMQRLKQAYPDNRGKSSSAI